MPSAHVSRRTVARGVAWSVPVVAVGVAVPAFAVSPVASPTADVGDSCKCAGAGANNYDFKTVLTFTGSGTTYPVAVGNISTSGTVQASIPAGAANDAAGVASAASTSTDRTVTYNLPPPAVTINQAAVSQVVGGNY